jgi:hypothetical protein
MAKAIIGTVLAISPVENGAPVTWKLGESVPGEADLLIQRMILIDGNVEVFVLPREGSALELALIQQTGMKQGLRYTLLQSGIKVIAAFAGINDWLELLKVADANSDDNYEVDDPDEDPEEDTEDEEEEEEEEVQTAPAVPPPPPTSFLPSPNTIVPTATQDPSSQS